MNKSQILSDKEKIAYIRQATRDAEQVLRERYSILQHQNAIGLSIFVLSIAGIIASGWLYYLGTIPAWACIISSAIFTSFLHELEHDLIHYMYFKKNKTINTMMMLGVWVFRGNVMNPWARRNIHLHHHKVSGTVDDTEERILGNGMKHGLVRSLIMMDASLSGNLFARRFRDLQSFSTNYVTKIGGWPVGVVFYVLWANFLGFHLLNTLFDIQWYSWITEYAMPVLNFIAVVNLIPNMLRQAILNFVTSNMHYYGDVDSLMKQTQVMNPWFYFPLHLFCFNFGSTHAIHHFVVNQPFYIREMVKKPAHQAMREMGVRFNDFGTFKRANRYAIN